MLTSAHLLGDEEAGAPTVRALGGTGRSACSVEWKSPQDKPYDVALLFADDPLVDEAVVGPLAPVTWARAVTLEPRPGFAIGFADVARRDDGSPDTDQFDGRLLPGAKLGEGRYVLESIHNPPRAGVGESPWSGMSGAPLFTEDRLVGVVCWEPTAFDHGRLEATPVHVLLGDPEFTAIVARLSGINPVLMDLSSSVADPFVWRPVAGTDALSLGAHRNRQAAGWADGLVPYIERDFDTENDHDVGLRHNVARLRETGGLLLLVGDSAAGKTRSAFEAMRRELPGHVVCAPDSAADLTGVEASAARQVAGCVLWLDGLESYLRSDGLTPGLLDELVAGRVVVLATMRSEHYEAFDRASAPRGAARDPQRVLGRARRRNVPRLWSSEERNRARSQEGDDPRLTDALGTDQSRHGVAEHLAAGPEAVDRWDRASRVRGHPRGAALVAASVDLARTGLRRPLDPRAVERLHGWYLDAAGGAALRPEPLAEAWTWAKDVILGVTSLLIPEADGQLVLPFDYLVSEAMRRSRLESLPDVTWREAAALVDEPGRGLLWRTAAWADRYDIVALVMDPSARRGDHEAMLVVGMALQLTGDSAGAERWWTAAAEDGEPLGAFNIGNLKVRSRELDQARTWYMRALEGGVTEAYGALGDVARDLGDDQQALDWWREGSELGDPGSTLSYSQALTARRRDMEAREALRRAAEADLPAAMLAHVGMLLLGHEWEEADRLVRRAYDRAQYAAVMGNEVGAFVAGLIAMGAGRLDEGRMFWRRAADAGSDHDLHLIERAGPGPGLRALVVNQEILDRLGEAELRVLMAGLWAQDCFDCGYGLPENGAPALHVQEATPKLTYASLSHLGICRYPGWGPEGFLHLRPGSATSWWAHGLGDVVELGTGKSVNIPMVIVNPSAEQRRLERDASGVWRAATDVDEGRRLGLRPLAETRELFLRPLGGSAYARLEGTRVEIHASGEVWEAAFDPRVAEWVRSQDGVLLVLSHGAGPDMRAAGFLDAVFAARDTLTGWVPLLA